MAMSETREQSWAETFAEMDHADRLTTIVEDGSTLNALIAEAHGYESLRVAVMTAVSDPHAEWADVRQALTAALGARR